MSIVTFINNEKFTLATSRVVYALNDTENVNSLVNKAKALSAQLESETLRIEQAEKKASELGYEKGQEEGYEAALEHIAVKLIALTREADSVRDKLESTAGDLALKIVSRVAADVGPGEMIAALATTAAKELVPREPVTLRVSLANLERVRKAIMSSVNRKHRLPEISGDPSLEGNACVLETEFGQIKADIDTQLRAFKEHFDEAKRT